MEDYKEKLRLAREALDSGSYDKETIEYIFPELKESEDERIRKALIELVRMVDKNPIHQIFGYGDIKYSDMIAWLEKQGKQNLTRIHEWKQENIHNLTDFEILMLHIGESFFSENAGLDPNDTDVVKEQAKLLLETLKQKPINKLEPKFKVGDTIRLKGSLAEYTIESISGECYHGKGWGLFIGCDEDYELVRQNHVWSEEDEKTLNSILNDLSQDVIPDDEDIQWLKSLKERMKGE